MGNGVRPELCFLNLQYFVYPVALVSRETFVLLQETILSQVAGKIEEVGRE